MKLSDSESEKLFEYCFLGGDTPSFLYEVYMDQMPYGTATAKTGDPDNWLADHFEDILNRFHDELVSQLTKRAYSINGKQRNEIADLLGVQLAIQLVRN